MVDKILYMIIAIIISTSILVGIKFLIFGTGMQYINGMPGPILKIENRQNCRGWI